MTRFSSHDVRTQLIRLALLVAAYLLATRLFNPGFFEPTVPSHSDIWRYFAYSRETFLLNVFASPRPVMLLAIKMLGVIPGFDAFAIALLIPAILLPLFILSITERILRVETSSAQVFMYFFLCFVLPSFYQLQMLDFGGSIAGILGCIAVNAFGRYVENIQSIKRDFALMAWPLVFVWMSMEAKPTYAALLVFIPMIYLRRIGWRKAIVASASAAIIILAVLVKDKILGSPFLDTAGAADSPYRIAPSFQAVIASLQFYVKAILPAGAWPLALAALTLTGIRWGWRSPAAIVCMSLLAILPMIAIPNNLLPMYSWFAATILLVPVGFYFCELESRKVRAASRVMLLPLLIVAIYSVQKSEATARYWYSSNHIANANTLRGIEALRAYIRPGQKVLIAGSLNAFSPFKNDVFIASRFPYSFDWQVTVPQVDAGLIPMSRDTKRLVLANDIDVSSFDLIASFSRDGVLLKVEPARNLVSLSRPEFIGRLFCPGQGVEGRRSCLQGLGEVDAAQALKPE